MPDQENLKSLTRSADSLQREVHELRQSLDNFGPRVRRVEWVSLLCVLVVIASVIAFTLYRQADTERRIHGLCPLFALIIGGANPESRQPGRDRDQYIETIRVITQAYGQLGCENPLVPPRVETEDPTPQG